MANSFTQLYIHYVFIPEGRLGYFTADQKAKIYPYLIGIAKEHKCYVHAINGGIDHVHILLSFPADKSVSEMAKLLKGNSSRFINQEKIYPCRFEWQPGYGAFTVSHSQLKTVKSYIEKQEEHHQKVKLKDEYLSLLVKHEIRFDEKYLPDM